MKKIAIKFSLFLNYFVFAILLNSVGIVILKSQKNYNVDEFEVSVLEGFKDLPIAIVSFLVASFLPRIGYKKSMLLGLLISAIACITMYFGNAFWSAKLLFALIGASFALIKVSVFTVVGLVTEDSKGHNSLMSSIEGVFMIGVAVAYFLFPAFNTEGEPDAWLRVYWVLAGLALLSFVFLLFTKFDQNHEIPGVDLTDDIRQMVLLCVKVLVIVFIISAFLFVMVEQGIMTWLPTFNEKVLHLTENISIMMASIFALSLAVGRIIAGIITKYVSWFYVLVVCIFISIFMVIFILPEALNVPEQTTQSFSDIPLIAFVFPLIGLFLSPIYPLINSTILSALPKKVHSPMTGLIVVFSALGGTSGSMIIGWLFKTVGPQQAFYYALVPMVLLLVSLFLLFKMTKDKQ